MGAQTDRRGERAQEVVRYAHGGCAMGKGLQEIRVAMQESLWGGEERLLHRPIYGGVFGTGRYALASMPCISRGLHSIRYMVVEPRAGAVLSVAEDKVEALAGARKILSATGELDGRSAGVQLEIWPNVEAANESPEPLKPISRRRREVFEKSVGKCHYCKTPLTLDGKWHVEHMMPRALGGTDDPLNLVAACTRCNYAKSDRTALEFVAKGESLTGSPNITPVGGWNPAEEAAEAPSAS